MMFHGMETRGKAPPDASSRTTNKKKGTNMKIDKTSVISYIALGVSIAALAIAIFDGCHKRPRRYGFGDGHPEMMQDGERMRGGRGHDREGRRPGMERRGPHDDASRDEMPKEINKQRDIK
ncbi:MAG: hypothetical protein LBO78_01825 [Rickettsiales bacterium]|jgi:hypothetical protein|nr:hypothetical protein [Rickettsiales bacterium]